MKPRHRGLTLFVTIGTTNFDQLIASIYEQQFIDHLCELNFGRLIVQQGSYVHSSPQTTTKGHLELEIYDYKPSIRDDIMRSDVVVGHAGAGTCLEVLRLNKKLIIIVNENLMDNHQRELAEQLVEENYAFQSSPSNLIDNIGLYIKSLSRKFPPVDPAKFRSIFEASLCRINR